MENYRVQKGSDFDDAPRTTRRTTHTPEQQSTADLQTQETSEKALFPNVGEALNSRGGTRTSVQTPTIINILEPADNEADNTVQILAIWNELSDEQKKRLITVAKTLFGEQVVSTSTIEFKGK